MNTRQMRKFASPDPLPVFSAPAKKRSSLLVVNLKIRQG